MEQITIKNEEVIRKKYKIRRTGKQGSSIETTIPPEAFEREARRLGYTPEEALEKLEAVWQFNNFRGLHLLFEPKETKE